MMIETDLTMSTHELLSTLRFYPIRFRALGEIINSRNMDHLVRRRAANIFYILLVAINVVVYVFMMIDRSPTRWTKNNESRALAAAIYKLVCTSCCVRQEKGNLFLLVTLLIRIPIAVARQWRCMLNISR